MTKRHEDACSHLLASHAIDPGSRERDRPDMAAEEEPCYSAGGHPPDLIRRGLADKSDPGGSEGPPRKAETKASAEVLCHETCQEGDAVTIIFQGAMAMKSYDRRVCAPFCDSLLYSGSWPSCSLHRPIHDYT